MERVVVVDHPAVAERLAIVRDERMHAAVFRSSLDEIGLFLAYEATRALPTESRDVRTPVAATTARRIAAGVLVAPVLRAGLALLPGFLRVVPNAEVAHLGIFRDPRSLAPVPYYANVPTELRARPAFVLDPMLATGGSAIAACRILTERGASEPTVICAIAAPEGIAALREAVPDVRVVTAAIDERLNEHGYIVPGLGDAGDRAYGTAGSVPNAWRAIV